MQGRSTRVSRARRQQLSREARRIHALGRTQGWTVDEIQAEILWRFPREVFPGEARMLAHGWNASLVREGVQALADEAGLDATGLQDADVLRWLRGETYPRESLDRLCRLFQCHQADLGWPVAPTIPAVDYTPERHLAATAPTEEPSAAQVTPATPDDGTLVLRPVLMLDGAPTPVEVRVPRSALVAAGGTRLAEVLIGYLDPAEGERVTAVVQRHRSADPRAVARLEAVLASYRTLEDLVGPRRLLDPVRSMLDLLADLRVDAKAPVQRSLLALEAQYWQFAGWLRVDLGDNDMAEADYDRALARAAEGGAGALVGYVLACKSERALMAGQADTALVRAQEAQRNTRAMSPAARAWAADLEARALALIGQEAKSKRRLDRAAELLANSAKRGRDLEPPWVYHFVEEALEVHRGICLTDLGDAAEATRVLDAAVEAVPTERVRDRAYYLTCAARAHARNDEPEHAADLARTAAQLAAATDSTRVLGKLQRLYTDDLDGLHQLQAVRALGELLPPPPADQ